MKRFVASFIVCVMAFGSTFFSPALTSATANSDAPMQGQTTECQCNVGKKKVEKEEAMQNLLDAGVEVQETISQQDMAKV
ncbi:MAG: hypothetical protein WCC10_05995, partial [Tumebacillaceae bacterium]